MERLIQAGRKALLLLSSRRAYLFRLRPRLLRLFDADLAHLAANLGLYYPLEPAPVPPPEGRVLVVAAHPDDEAIGCGGSLILAGRGGAKLTLAFLTDGRPPDGPEDEAQALAARRRGEAEAAAARLGASLELFGAPVRTLPRNRDLADRAAGWLADLVGRFEPQAVLTPFPLDAHSDHRLAAWLTARALAGRGDLPVWAYEVATSSLAPANVVVDITQVEKDKAALINLYASQMAGFDYANAALGLNRFHSRHLRGRGAAEVFFRLPAGRFIELMDRFSSEQIFGDRG